MHTLGGRKYDRFGTVSEYPMIGFPVCVVPIGYAYKIALDEYRYIAPFQHEGVMRPSCKALAKNLGHVDLINLKLLGDMWKEGHNWFMATDGGLKDGIGTCGTVLYNREIGKEVCTSMSAES